MTLAQMKRPDSLSSAAEDMTFLMIWEIVRTGLLREGTVSHWAHIDALITWLTINGIRICCLQIISPPAGGTLCSMWNVGPGNVPVMGSQDC